MLSFWGKVRASVRIITLMICSSHPVCFESSVSRGGGSCPAHPRPTQWSWCSCTPLSPRWTLKKKMQGHTTHKTNVLGITVLYKLYYFEQLIPMVGIVVTISPSLSLYRMVVFPAASSPTIRILISFFPMRLFNKFPKMFPMILMGFRSSALSSTLILTLDVFSLNATIPGGIDYKKGL